MRLTLLPTHRCKGPARDALPLVECAVNTHYITWNLHNDNVIPLMMIIIINKLQNCAHLLVSSNKLSSTLSSMNEPWENNEGVHFNITMKLWPGNTLKVTLFFVYLLVTLCISTLLHSYVSLGCKYYFCLSAASACATFLYCFCILAYGSRSR